MFLSRSFLQRPDCLPLPPFQIEQHVHRDAPRSNRRRRLRPALTGVAVPPASPAVVGLSASSSATISAPRSAVDPSMPARTAGSSVWPDVSSNLSPKAAVLSRTYSAKGIRVRTDTRGDHDSAWPHK